MPIYRPTHVGLQYSEALAEAYVHAPADDPVLVTLELHHPDFRDEAGDPTAARVVNDWQPLLATLEADAPLNAGEEVSFAGIPFTFVRPAETDSGAPSAITIVIDNLNAQITRYILQAQESEEPLLVILRTYLPSDTSAPHELPVVKLYVASPVTIDPGSQARLQCSFGDLTNRKFPRLEYTRETHPTLAVS
jgi:hypothetical protein